MSTTTTNFDLIKPALSDPADVTATNPNWDKIDTTLFKSIKYLGVNPIYRDIDTVSNWVALGSGYARYTNTGTVIDKPSTYGIIVSYCVEGNDVFQFWYDAPSGPLYHRGGNTNGWYGTWKRVYDDVYKPVVEDVIPTQLGISKGGTNATTRKDAIKNLAFLGTDPVTTSGNDTTSTWSGLGSGYAWYSKNGQLTGQPSNYGLLLNFCPNAYEVTQFWKCHATGALWIRSGNAQGWGQAWAKVYDSLNRPTPSDIGVADYVIENGASGGWAYRKYKSGYVELRGTFEIVIPATATSTATYVDLPFNLTSPRGFAQTNQQAWKLSAPVDIGFENSKVKVSYYTKAQTSESTCHYYLFVTGIIS